MILTIQKYETQFFDLKLEHSKEIGKINLGRQHKGFETDLDFYKPQSAQISPKHNFSAHYRISPRASLGSFEAQQLFATISSTEARESMKQYLI